MANIVELLEALNNKDVALPTADLAKELKASKEGTLKQLNREKDKGTIEGNSQEGWLITDAGRKALEKGEIHPSMIDEGVTNRQQFEAIGRRIGIKEDRIVLATDIVWSADFNDITWVWLALGQADIANDLRSVWVNAWRAKLHKGIPAEIEPELTGVGKTLTAEGEKDALSKQGREYIIYEEEPVRVGENLGDYSLQDAKDILAIRALRNRFATGTPPGASTTPKVSESVSDILTALSPYLNKEGGSNIDTLKEVLADKLELQKQDILSRIPQQGTTQPKSFIEQITDAVAALGSLKEVGPLLRSILGVPGPSSNPETTQFPVQLTGADGTPIVMDLSKYIDLERFRGEERRADERHSAIVGVAQAVRENLGDGVAAIKAAVGETRKVTGAKTPSEPQPYECSDCHTQFAIPDVPFETVKCPNPQCGRVYTREEVLSS